VNLLTACLKLDTLLGRSGDVELDWDLDACLLNEDNDMDPYCAEVWAWGMSRGRDGPALLLTLIVVALGQLVKEDWECVGDLLFFSSSCQNRAEIQNVRTMFLKKDGATTRLQVHWENLGTLNAVCEEAHNLYKQASVLHEYHTVYSPAHPPTVYANYLIYYHREPVRSNASNSDFFLENNNKTIAHTHFGTSTCSTSYKAPDLPRYKAEHTRQYTLEVTGGAPPNPLELAS
jgi:hypothetical protein